MPDTVNGRTHYYQAEATILTGQLTLPLVQEIKKQATASLPVEGGYISQRSENYRLESVMSYRSAYTQVSGNLDPKPGHGWATLSTTAIEGLNVLDILTADRVVGQIITEHPLEGYVPSVSFLGTRYENLRIAGEPVKLDLDLKILGPKPAKDGSYTRDEGVISRVKGQYAHLLEHRDLPEELREGYNRLFSTLGSSEAVECSLVNRATGNIPGRTYGHVIDVPDFGKVILGKLNLRYEEIKKDSTVERKTTVNLTMIDLQMGCAGGGNSVLGGGSTNGTTMP